MLRRLALWMLLLVLPLQGLAAAAGTHCASMQGSGRAALAATVHSASGDTRQVMPAASNEGCDEPAAPVRAHVCSACHHCCSASLAMGVLPAVAALDMPVAVHRALPIPPPLYTSVVLDAPRRPPRLALSA